MMVILNMFFGQLKICFSYVFVGPFYDVFKIAFQDKSEYETQITYLTKMATINRSYAHILRYKRGHKRTHL